MRRQSRHLGYLLGTIVVLSSACAPKWNTKEAVDPRLIQRALDDPAYIPREPFKPESVPVMKPPTAIRPCCAFGMDLKAKAGAIPVPGYKNDNILGIPDLGQHGYDKGFLPGENNGLVYTCRGGFIDLAHIRDNADRTLYLTMEFVRRLPDGFTLEMPEEGALRRIVIKQLPPGVLDRYGRWFIATQLAEWVNYQFSIWHEISTWYGWQSIKGVSERLSAFSPEDLYSNVVGQRLASGLILNRESSSRDGYDRAMDAWIAEGLRRLGAVSHADGRAAMKSVDGIIWDSQQRVPDMKVVLKRNLVTASPLKGWLVENSVPKGPVHDELKRMCEKLPPPLPLSVPEKIGDQKITELVTIQFEFAGWIPESFPLPAQKGNTITDANFPEIIKDIRVRGEKELGPGFDDPRAGADPKGPMALLRIPSVR